MFSFSSIPRFLIMMAIGFMPLAIMIIPTEGRGVTLSIKQFQEVVPLATTFGLIFALVLANVVGEGMSLIGRSILNVLLLGKVYEANDEVVFNAVDVRPEILSRNFQLQLRIDTSSGVFFNGILILTILLVSLSSFRGDPTKTIESSLIVFLFIILAAVSANSSANEILTFAGKRLRQSDTKNRKRNYLSLMMSFFNSQGQK